MATSILLRTNLLFAVLFCFIKLEAQKIIKADVCVYGGTSAGVIAAYTAQKMGKKAILIEPGRHLGGMSSGGLGYTDIGNKYAIGGLALDFYRRIGKHYGKFEQWIFEPKVAEAIFNDYIRRGVVEVLYETRLKEVKKNGTRITSIILEDAEKPQASKNVTVEAAMFIDCGYEGDLMAKAGVEYAVGREGNSTYNETINGVQLMKGHQLPDGIDPYIIKGKPESGLVWGVSNGKLDSNGTGDKKVQAYNYRICLSSDPNNSITITKPHNYDSTRYALFLRVLEAAPQKRKLYDFFIWSKMPNNKTDINNKGGFSTDMIGMNYNYPDGTYEERNNIIRDHESYTKGLLYFVGHDPRVPEAIRNEMLRWGYPKDEYTDNDNWSPQLYVREARRMIGNYVMTQANCEGKEVVKDGVGMAAYTMDSHNCQRIVINGQVKNEGNVEVGGFGPYPIAYGAIIPKQNQCTNLFVPVCLSATHIAYGSIRMEPVFMRLAQSAAMAATLAIDAKIDIQNVDVVKLQKIIKLNPMADGSRGDILIDNDDATGVQRIGNWSVEKKGGYGTSYIVSKENNASVRFTPIVSEEGVYTAYAYFPKSAESTSVTIIKVYDGKQLKDKVIKKSDIVVEGQTSGEWIALGDHVLSKGNTPYVEITTEGSDGVVIADAVIFVPKEK